MTRRTWLLMAGAAATWGASYMFIKVALDDLSEGALVFVRVALGAAVLLPLAARAGALAPLRGRLGWLAAITVTQVVAPFLLITFGEHDVPSAMAGILVSAAPIFTALLATRMDRSERLTGWSAAGIAIGMVGVVLLFGVDLSGNTESLLGGGLILLAAACYALSAFLVKRHLTGAPPVGIVAGQMVFASLFTLPLFLADPPTALPHRETVLAMLALGAGGTGIAFLWYYTLLAELGPSRASLIAYLAPGFAVLYGAVVLGEAITAATVGGLVLILAGSWLGTTAVSRSGPSRSSGPAPARAR